MDGTAADPRCPECGEPIGQRATFCMHCSADLTDERAADDLDGDGTRDDRDAATEAGSILLAVRESIANAMDGTAERSEAGGDRLLDPDGLVDDTLTVVVGIAGGLVIGILLTVELLVLMGRSLALPLGVAAWLGATAYLVRRYTFQGAVAASGYGIAIVLLGIPLVAFSPVVSVQGGLADRGGLFLTLGVFVAFPVLVAAAVGFVASRYAPAGTPER